MNFKFILFIPLIEIILFILLGDFLGFFNVIFLIMLTGFIGFFLIKSDIFLIILDLSQGDVFLQICKPFSADLRAF